MEAQSFNIAVGLIISGNQQIFDIVKLSLGVTLSALTLASVVGLPLGAMLAIFRFPLRGVIITLFNTLMGLPPVLAGLSIYVLVSRSGPLGGYGILFTPTAMIAAQFVLILPIIVSLTRTVVADLWEEYREQLDSLGSLKLRSIPTLLFEARFSLTTGIMAGFGRASAEVGAVLIVGGNIAGHTRTMTTAIALETSKGNLGFAIALGILLLGVTLVVNLGAIGIGHWSRRLSA